MQKSIKLAIASMLIGTIGMAAIPAGYASAATANGNKTTVEAGHSTLVSLAKKKSSKMKPKKVSSMKKR
ncbi:hypothetical protein [Chamaesiphon sp. GL140_3_metabinner_50]|uniref:hypothetical protein n=1 Tax=Chamaesiphon sp. GL140_3_metabinner_50 TaxID=2970812 RepID=UPI0025FBE962|nr:hypothetical protein [Chamaesiphon sp. GL140_3_metabinner_50]